LIEGNDIAHQPERRAGYQEGEGGSPDQARTAEHGHEARVYAFDLVTEQGRGREQRSADERRFRKPATGFDVRRRNVAQQRHDSTESRPEKCSHHNLLPGRSPRAHSSPLLQLVWDIYPSQGSVRERLRPRRDSAATGQHNALPLYCGARCLRIPRTAAATKGARPSGGRTATLPAKQKRSRPPSGSSGLLDRLFQLKEGMSARM